MHRILKIVLDVIVVALGAGAVGWLLYRCLKRTEDPARLVFKWVLTVPVVWFMFMVVGPMAGSGGAGAILFLPTIALCAVVLLITWRHNIAGLVAKPFSSLYDGGTEEAIPRPAYSIAQSKQKKGQYLEAVVEIRKQLDRFPTDVEGQMLLAQIQAEDLKDLPAAELTIEHLCAQPGHAPQNIAFALYSLADWHLGVGKDREAAQRDLEKIIELLPESEVALGAAHRIAHLSSAEMLLAPEERRKFVVTEGVKNIGLMRGRETVKTVEPTPEEMAQQYVKHLEQHPLDAEAREKLAILYVDHYHRLDLATGELEQMIGLLNQPGRLVVHWLNLLADLQIRSGSDFETVQETLQRIVDRDPNAAPANIARNRLALLRLEMRAKEKSQGVKLGSYEQNIGLKRGLTRR